MRQFIALSLGVIALALAGCRREDTTPEEAVAAIRQQSVEFTAIIDSYAVKSAGTAFDDGDAIGVFAPDNFGRRNVKGIISGIAVALDEPINWEPVSKAVFVSYFPYDPNVSGTAYSFSVRTDQVSAEAFKQSDLRAAVTMAPHGQRVDFTFRHCLSKLTVLASCEDAGETVTGVTIGRMHIEVQADLEALAVTLGGNEAEVKAGHHGGEGFEAILVPQTLSDLPITVTTSSGRSITFHPAEPLVLESGYAYSATLSVPKDENKPDPLTFTFTLVDWEDVSGNIDFSETN